MSKKPWFLRGRWRYVAAIALIADLGLGAFSTAMAIGVNTGVKTAVVQTASAQTIAWTDSRTSYDSDYVDGDNTDPGDPNQPSFKDLKVSISQTQDLTDQGLQVTWTGGKTTSPGTPASNFLQIMQCWASSDAGPTPEQCQWGTPNATLGGQTGSMASSRDLLLDPDADPKQSLGPEVTHAQFGLDPVNTIPFWSISDPGRTQLGWTNDSYNLPPFNAAQTNEVTYARTAADGTGQAIFALQSALSAPYLGCGDPTYTSQGKSCWLVVVPRGEYNPDGQKAVDHEFAGGNYTSVAGSPLSASVWQDRIQFKLNFAPAGASCPVKGAEVQTAGTELISAAFSSWQSALCGKGIKFGYSEIGDGEARSALLAGGSSSPAMDFVYSPVDPETASSAHLLYAPVATSSIVVSYLIDKNYRNDPDNSDAGSNGTLVTDLRLTPLLIAKLLTQSYKVDVPGQGSGTGSLLAVNNPSSLRSDPEFVQLNPTFKYFFDSAAPDGLMVPFGDTDAAKAVWAWLRSDPAALSFLKGNPDKWGTIINPAYRDLGLADDDSLASFPKADPSLFRTGDAPAPGYGTIDLRPYTAGFADGAVRTINATNGQKTFWDVGKSPAQYAAGGAQVPGARFELAITTSQAAALYGAPTATLVSDAASADPGVGPTTEAMLAEAAGARTSTGVPNVNAVDPSKSVAGGYPLTLPTYAAINLCAPDRKTLTAFSAFLTYAAGAGQTSGAKFGQLPFGYAPLSAADRAVTNAVAKKLLAKNVQAPCTPKAPAAAPSATSTPAAEVVPPPVTPVSAPSAPPASPPAKGVDAAVPGGVTPAAFVTPAGRYALLAALCFALPCLIGGPSLLTATRLKR